MHSSAHVSRRFHVFALLVLVASTTTTGCNNGPKLGTVTGTVRFQGEPVENARVTFTPENGRMSVAETDAEGTYELKFADGRLGAELGEHLVAIETYRISTDDNGGVVEFPETLPAKYNRESELTRDVQQGAQVIDFDLAK